MRLISFVSALLLSILLVESCSLLVKGWYFTDIDSVKECFDKHDCELIRDGLIISVNNSPLYASMSAPSITCKWYIRYLGSVPRCSELHYYLEQKRLNLLTK